MMEQLLLKFLAKLRARHFDFGAFRCIALVEVKFIRLADTSVISRGQAQPKATEPVRKW
jgi:hypothetical protein